MTFIISAENTYSHCQHPFWKPAVRQECRQAKRLRLMRKPHPAHSGHQVTDPRAASSRNLPELSSTMTIVIAGRHGQERISFRMLLPSEPLSRAMLSSSVCHAPPSMSSWVFACPHRQQPSQSHATSCGKSMTHHIACHVQRRLCSCSDSLVVCPADSSAESVASKRCRMF